MSTNILQEKLNEQTHKALRRKRLQIRLFENWWVVLVLILAIYSGLPIAAPALMKAGATGTSNAIYSVYGYMCHQFSFRSVFLFGEQTAYPRAETGITNIETFEERAPQSEEFVAQYTERRKNELRDQDNPELAAAYVFNPDELKKWTPALQQTARSFRGDEEMGYKIALCQRDIAIYVTMTFTGILYGLFRKRIRPVPLWLYALLGIGPIALDGFSQLLGYPPFELWDPRETTPTFRIMTGALFGFMNVWLAFPYINASMQENANRVKAFVRQVEAKMGSMFFEQSGEAEETPENE